MHYDEEQNQFVISMQMKKAEWILLSLMVRPNKIKVLVLRQRRPLKISADGTFLLPYRKKIATAPYFWIKQILKFSAKFKFSNVPVTQTSFDKRLNDWSIENESKNSAWLRVKTLSDCPRQF